ncbi:MAG: hypothetical protein WC850_02085 [Candidatus Gracilibacteria bacterium]
MLFDKLRRFVRMTNEGDEIKKENLSIEKVVVNVGGKTASLIEFKKSKTSIGNFYINYQILISEEIKQDIKMGDIDALNFIIEDSENLKKEIEKENDVYLLEGYKDDILDIIIRKKELLKSNSNIEEGLNALIEVINRRIESVKSK